eukprot:gene38339-47333_t
MKFLSGFYFGNLGLKIDGTCIPNGFGTVSLRFGGSYVGEWLNGKLHGEGCYTDGDFEQAVMDDEDEEEEEDDNTVE